MTRLLLVNKKQKPIIFLKMSSFCGFPSGIDYPVQLIGGPHGALDIGNFRIDESRIGVVPSSLKLIR